MKKLIILCILFPIIVFAQPPSILSFADDSLTIPTYEVSCNKVVHPSVIYSSTGIYSHNYWMAITPFCDGSVSENPSIFFSDDGITWDSTGTGNPISGIPATGYYSDPDIVYDDSLYCLYRGTNTPDIAGVDTDGWFVLSSGNGTTWGNKRQILGFSGSSHDVARGISPCVIAPPDSDFYYIYAVAGQSRGATRGIYRYKATELKQDSVTFDQWCFLSKKIDFDVWHMEVVLSGAKWYMLISGSDTSYSNALYLYLATSDDGINWNVNNYPLLGYNQSTWQAQQYRGTFVVGADDSLRVWYNAAYGTETGWYVAKTTGYIPDILRDINQNRFSSTEQ